MWPSESLLFVLRVEQLPVLHRLIVVTTTPMSLDSSYKLLYFIIYTFLNLWVAIILPSQTLSVIRTVNDDNVFKILLIRMENIFYSSICLWLLL